MKTSFFYKKPQPFVIILLLIALFWIGISWVNKTDNEDILSKMSTFQSDTKNNNFLPPQIKTSSPKSVIQSEHIRGNKQADIFLIEYSDYECPFCKLFHTTMLKVLKDYDGRVAWVYRHFPLPSHFNAEKAAEASECVTKLGGNEAFWKFTDLYFERTDSNGFGFPLNKLATLGEEIGLNSDKMQLCINNGEFAEKVASDLSEGKRSGVNGTPGTFVFAKDGQKEYISGALPYKQVKQILDKYLN